MDKKYVYTYDRQCEVCNKQFQTNRYSTKICSKECVSIKISQSKTKYTEDQNLEAIKLKSQGLIMNDIAAQTGMTKAYITKLFHSRKVLLSESQKKQNIARRWKDHEPIQNDSKKCGTCKEAKDLIHFNANNNRKSGFTTICKQCTHLNYLKNQEKILIQTRDRKLKHPEKYKENAARYYNKNKNYIIERVAAYDKANPHIHKKAGKKWRENNKPHLRMKWSERRANQISATPPWLTDDHRKQIFQIYNNCPKGYHVDHIIPLNSDIVCGLHVPWNLEAIPAQLNLSKGNFIPIQTKLPKVCHQKTRRDETLEEDLKNGAPVDVKITDFTLQVEKLSLEHKKFIERYEWLGTIGRGTKWVFTGRYSGMLGGVVLISEPNSYIQGIDKKLQALIHRGACASWTPKNLASKLISFSCRWMTQNTEKRLFSAYSDPEAGEIGTVYQACNFDYIGSRWGAKTKFLLPKWWSPTEKETTSQYFNQTAFYKKACKHLGIEWLPAWSKDNGFKNLNTIPKHVKKSIKELVKIIKADSQQIIAPPKGKYLLLLGQNKTEQRHLDKIKNWNSEKYIKRNPTNH